MLLNLIAKLGLDASSWELGMKRAGSQSKQFTQVIKSELTKAFGTAALIAYTAKLANMAGQIVETSDQLGISTKALQQWSHSAKQSGSNIEQVTKYFERLNLAREKAMGGDLGAMQSFRNLGVGEQDLGTKSLEDLAQTIAATVSSGDIQALSSSLKDIGGDTASKLVPAMKDFADLSQEASIISDEHLEQLNSTTDELEGMGATLGQSLIPYMAKFAKLASDGASAITIGLSVMKAAASSLWNGASLKETWAAMNSAMDEGIDSWEQKRKMVEARAARRANRSGPSTGIAGDIMHDLAPAKEAAERIASNGGGSNRPSLTPWQQMGAAVQFRVRDEGNTLLGEIAKSNLAIAKNTDPKANKINRPALMDGNFGAYQ